MNWKAAKEDNDIIFPSSDYSCQSFSTCLPVSFNIMKPKQETPSMEALLVNCYYYITCQEFSACLRKIKRDLQNSNALTNK